MLTASAGAYVHFFDVNGEHVNAVLLLKDLRQHGVVGIKARQKLRPLIRQNLSLMLSERYIVQSWSHTRKDLS